MNFNCKMKEAISKGYSLYNLTISYSRKGKTIATEERSVSPAVWDGGGFDCQEAASGKLKSDELFYMLPVLKLRTICSKKVNFIVGKF